MKKLLYKKINKEFYITFIIFSLSLCLIIWILQAVNYLEFVVVDGHGFLIYFNYIILLLPKILSKLFPILFFISFFFLLTRMEEKNEINIYWFNGLSKKKFIKSQLNLSLIFLIFNLFLTNFIVPKSQDIGRNLLKNSSIDYFPSLIKEKQFIDVVKNLTIFIEEKNGENYKNIFLQDDRNNEEVKTIYAKNGKIFNNKIFILKNGEIINDNNDNITKFFFEELTYDLSSFTTKSITTQKLQEKDSFELIKCIFEVMEKNTSFECSNANQILNEYLQEVSERIFLPLFIPILYLISSILLNYSMNSFNYSKIKTIIFLLGFATVIVSNILVRYFNEINLLNISIIILPLLLLLIAYYMLREKEYA